jgi:hypothetical protein
MIKAFKLFTAWAITFAALISCVPANGDTFTLYPLTTDSYIPIGIDSAGNVLINTTGDCNVPGSFDCFVLFSQGIAVSQSATFPATFIADNGSPCAFSAPPGFGLIRSVCNNGYQVAALLDSPSEILEFYPGSSPSGDLITNLTSAAQLFINSSGDVVFVFGGGDGRIYESILNTPEPSTFVFLGTGTIGLIMMARRRSPKGI